MAETLIVRTDEEILAARDRAQGAAFRAEDNGDSDEGAESAYQVLQWLTGSRSDDPTLEMAGGQS